MMEEPFEGKARLLLQMRNEGASGLFWFSIDLEIVYKQTLSI